MCISDDYMLFIFYFSIFVPRPQKKEKKIVAYFFKNHTTTFMQTFRTDAFIDETLCMM